MIYKRAAGPCTLSGAAKPDAETFIPNIRNLKVAMSGKKSRSEDIVTSVDLFLWRSPRLPERKKAEIMNSRNAVCCGQQPVLNKIQVRK